MKQKLKLAVLEKKDLKTLMYYIGLQYEGNAMDMKKIRELTNRMWEGLAKDYYWNGESLISKKRDEYLDNTKKSLGGRK